MLVFLPNTPLYSKPNKSEPIKCEMDIQEQIKTVASKGSFLIVKKIIFKN